MLKGILSMFGIIGKASVKQSEQSLKLMKNSFERAGVNGLEKYTFVFGYAMKAGMMSTRISSYVIAFSSEEEKIAILPIYTDTGEFESPVILSKQDITKISTTIGGEKKICSPLLSEELRFIVPYYTKEDAQEIYQLPIVQMEAASNFDLFIKEKF